MSVGYNMLPHDLMTNKTLHISNDIDSNKNNITIQMMTSILCHFVNYFMSFELFTKDVLVLEY